MFFFSSYSSPRDIPSFPTRRSSDLDPAENVFYIQQGRVKIKVKSKQGKEAVIAILGAGEFLGEACLIGQDRKSTRLNSSHLGISYAVFCLKNKIRIDKSLSCAKHNG